MLINIKLVAASVLAVGALGFWVPKLVGGSGPEPEAFEVDPTDPTGGAFFDGYGPEEAGAEPVAVSQQPANGGDQGAEIGIAPPRGGASTSPSSDLDTRDVLDLVAQLRGGSSARPLDAAPGETGQDGPARGSLQPAPGPAQVFDPIPLDLTFLNEHHGLSGILIGKTRSAVLGDEIVREGGSFAGGRARLVRVRPEHVVVEVDGDQVLLPLPPFKTLAPANSFDETDPGV